MHPPEAAECRPRCSCGEKRRLRLYFGLAGGFAVSELEIAVSVPSLRKLVLKTHLYEWNKRFEGFALNKRHLRHVPILEGRIFYSQKSFCGCADWSRIPNVTTWFVILVSLVFIPAGETVCGPNAIFMRFWILPKNHRKLRVIAKRYAITDEDALKDLCRGKVEPMDLGNHVTVFNALKNLPSPHRENLKHMGYNTLKSSFWCCLIFMQSSIRRTGGRGNFQSPRKSGTQTTETSRFFGKRE